MDNYKLTIDNIYWERIQLFIEGHTDCNRIERKKLVLRNLTETKEVEANEVKVEGNRFKARFNIAILDNGNYLPSGQYLLILKKEFEHIAHINEVLLNPSHYDLDDEQYEHYHSLETTNDKNNFLLKEFEYQFKKGGNSKKINYNVYPKISKEVNEFVLDVKFNMLNPKTNKLIVKFNEYKKSYNTKSYKLRDFLFKSIFNTTKFFHLKKGNTVLFTSDSRAEMSGNFEYVYNEMLRQNLDEKYKIHALFKSNI
ncbi:CDP-glycerol glycerophosphotransferase family protein, partial [Staphylococcus shinii]|uniref:CDP-glycerol glycerophosphotransferase family protein n=5 Tax=Staphylococcus TaxID=1279 RepID=UPI003F554F56